MSTDAVVTLGIFLLAQTGALVYFAGSIRTEVNELKRRATATEIILGRLTETISYLQGREGMKA
jgi:hypothetical protein